MLQEIITYMIIGSAVTLSILKIANHFKKKRAKKHPANKSQADLKSGHNCSSCSAECVLRDLPQNKIKIDSELCKKVETRS